MQKKFLPDKKLILLKCAHKIFLIYVHPTVSIQSFFMRYSKMHIKIGGWKLSYLPHLRAFAHKKEKSCIDTQRNEVSGFPDGSHLLDEFLRLQMYVPFLHTFLKNVLNMNRL